MNEQPDDALDQADEQILTSTVSDDALEAAAGTEEGTYPYSARYSPTHPALCC